MSFYFNKAIFSNGVKVVKFKKISSSFITSLLLIVGLAASADAALITVNSQRINAYDIHKDSNASSFADFYNYQGNIAEGGSLLPFSSNTGLDIPNQIVMMVIKDRNNYGLIGLISGRGGIGGGVTMSYLASNPVSAFIDDPDEVKNGGYVNASEIKWVYFKDRGDGFIFSGFQAHDWSIVTLFKDFSPNIKGDINVLSFDEDNKATSLSLARDESILFRSVSAPSAIALFMLTSFVIVFQARRKQ